jgi:HTH-type transcriptional regulator / antitoxin HigA
MEYSRQEEYDGPNRGGCMMMDVKPLHNEHDYDWAIREVSRYFEVEPLPEPLMETVSRFCLRSSRSTEDKRFVTLHGDPVNVLHFAIDSMGRSQAELAKLIGRNRASEILNRIRPLTLEIIHTVSKEWNIPIGALTAQYKLAHA